MARLLWLLPVGLLQACAGTPVAEQLERSFAVPQARPAQAAAAGGGPLKVPLYFYTLYFILYALYFILYTLYCILYTVYCILYSLYCIVYTV